MKNCLTAGIIGSMLAFCILTGCEKTDNFTSAPVDQFYIKGQVGKYILYNLDSTRYVDFGQRDTVLKYQAKDSVISLFTDLTGRQGWRVVRYVRPIASISPFDWKPSLTYEVIPSRETVEVLEANFRFVKLALPVSEGHTWRGNGYLPNEPYRDVYEFSNDATMQSWQYDYRDVNASLTINNKNYDSTVTVTAANDSIVDIDGVIRNRTRWIEKYAKNIGLVEKEVIMYEFQPTNGSVQGYKHGYGVRMEIIDHN